MRGAFSFHFFALLFVFCIFATNYETKTKNYYIMEHQLIVDSDLIAYVSKKENINTFINFCIRERMEAENNMMKRKVRRPSLEERENRHLNSDTLKPLCTEEVENPNTPFFGKKIVITGQFLAFPKRDVLGKLLKQYGADMNTSISKKTDIVIMGYAAGPKKKDLIKDLKGQGFPIQVYNEEQLLKVFDEYQIPHDELPDEKPIIIE